MLLKGKPVADKIKDEIKEVVNRCKESGDSLPRLEIIRIGARADDVAYESRVLKNCQELGIEVKVVVVDDKVDTVNLASVIEKSNKDEDVHGILIFRPLPEQIDMEIINRTILPEKDIDCMNPVNFEKIFEGDKTAITPCTPKAVIEILKHYGYDLKGKNVAIINRSLVLGKPLAMMFLDENATVTICHSKTENLSEITKTADIVVTGAGKAKLFGNEFFSDKSVIIDVGINMLGDTLCGDTDFEQIKDTVSAITPVPGGVGIVTSAILLKNVINAMKNQKEGR